MKALEMGRPGDVIVVDAGGVNGGEKVDQRGDEILGQGRRLGRPRAKRAPEQTCKAQLTFAA
ncbi:MAG: hypothetical protein WAU78_09165 [Roseiarcus sp.]